MRDSITKKTKKNQSKKDTSDRVPGKHKGLNSNSRTVQIIRYAYDAVNEYTVDILSWNYL
jgi:hypothetical protein